MSWVRLDDSIADHPKIAPLSSDAFRRYINGLCYCNRQLTDGVIPRAVAGGLVPGSRAVSRQIRELITAGLWEETATGYVVHDYADYQPSKADALALRAKRAEAGRRGGQSKSGSKRQANPEAKHKLTRAFSHPIPIDPLTPAQRGNGNEDEEDPRAAGTNPRALGTNPRAVDEREQRERSRRLQVERTILLAQAWLAEPDQTLDLVAHQIRDAFPDIAEDVIQGMETDGAGEAGQ
jgi:hypothetical protein